MHEIQVKYQKQIEELVEACGRVSSLGYVTSHGGNLSYRVAEDIVLITPTKVEKRNVKFEDVCAIDMQGKVLYAAPGRKPTGEWPFHVRIFQKRPDVRGIVHAHPPMLTGFAIANSDLLSLPTLPEPILEVGRMLMVPYAEPLSDELAEMFDEYIVRSNGFLMQNHGALMVSTDSVLRAQDFMEMMEAAAQSVLVAKLLGNVGVIPEKEIANLDRVMQTRNLPIPGIPGRIQSLTELFKEK